MLDWISLGEPEVLPQLLQGRLTLEAPAEPPAQQAQEAAREAGPREEVGEHLLLRHPEDIAGLHQQPPRPTPPVRR